jgi:hypothetical protein
MALEDIAIRECEGGRAYADEDAAKLDWLAGVSGDWNRGDFVIEAAAYIDDPNTVDGRTRGKRRDEVQAETIAGFPDRIQCREAIALVQSAFERFNTLYGTTWSLNTGSGKSMQKYYDAMRDAGFPRQDRTGGGCWWVRRARPAGSQGGSLRGKTNIRQYRSKGGRRVGVCSLV